MSKATPSDAHLRRLLVRAASGDLEAFVDFYDATCSVTWRLELCRHVDPEQARRATIARYVGAWLHAGAQARSGLSARAWLLSLSPDLMPPVARAGVARIGVARIGA